MLTDRQNKFLSRIITLSEDKSLSTEKEQVYLKRAITAINDGVKFQIAINDLNYYLVKRLKEKKHLRLSEEVEKLSDRLIEVYGEPVLRMVDGGGSDIPINPLTH